MITAEDVALRLKEYAGYRGFVQKERHPVLASEVRIGTKVQNWGLPNRLVCLAIGFRENGNLVVALRTGQCVTIEADAWMAIVEESTAARRAAAARVFNRLMETESEVEAIWS